LTPFVITVEVDDYESERIWRHCKIAGTQVTLVVAGDSGVAVFDTNKALLPAATADAFREMARNSLQRVLMRVFDAPDTSLRVAGQRRLRGQLLDGVEAHFGRDTVSLWFDPLDHRISAVESRATDPVLGLATTLTEFANFRRPTDRHIQLTVLE
jgi:hypothetical protein